MSATTSTNPAKKHVSRRTLAAGAAWSVPAVAFAATSPAHAASDRCEDNGIQPFPAPIQMFDKDDQQPPSVNLLPYTANGWTARRIGNPDKGGFSYSNFAGRGFRMTLDPQAQAGASIETVIQATANTIAGCSYTLVSTYELTGVGNDRPLVARFQVNGVGSGQQVNSNSSPVTGSITTTFVATAATTTIGLWTRVTGTANANGGVDINMSEPTITCSCAN
ncbi:hypothetical protein [Demetria terragena]|uniref:hypothetical protein n=1 Tax=Demetria terragena TaxID=63959 RepID=UPI0003819249|nr:hypothetical protein [Demetria terragena]